MKIYLLTGLAISNEAALWGDMEIVPLLDGLPH